MFVLLQDDARLQQEQSTAAASTWLPYTLIDQVLAAADSTADLSARGRGLREELRTEISDRVRQLEKLSQLVR